MKQVKEKWSDGVVDVGIFNTGGKFAPGHFLEGKEEDLRENVESSMYVHVLVHTQI